MLEDPRAKNFFKISRKQWTSSASANADDTGTFRAFLDDPIDGLFFPFEDECGEESMYEDGLCHKHEIEKCICWQCCRDVYFSRQIPLMRVASENLYYWRADDTFEIPEAPDYEVCERLMNNAGDYLQEKRLHYLEEALQRP